MMLSSILIMAACIPHKPSKTSANPLECPSPWVLWERVQIMLWRNRLMPRSSVR